MRIFRIYGEGTASSFSLKGIKNLYDDGRTPINAMQTAMAVINWIKGDGEVWLWDDGESILFDDGSTIELK